mgnify:CR=1 FL=1
MLLNKISSDAHELQRLAITHAGTVDNKIDIFNVPACVIARRCSAFNPG